MTIAKDFIANSTLRMNESFDRVSNCLNRIENNQVWQSPNPSTNSIGHLILHLNGNISQYILKGLGDISYQRQRDLEFNSIDHISKESLEDIWSSLIDRSIQVVENLSKDQLTSIYNIQGFKLSGTGVIIHVVEHLSYHVGQIALLTKLFKNEDLRFYDGLDLNL